MVMMMTMEKRIEKTVLILMKTVRLMTVMVPTGFPSIHVCLVFVFCKDHSPKHLCELKNIENIN